MGPYRQNNKKGGASRWEVRVYKDGKPKSTTFATEAKAQGFLEMQEAALNRDVRYAAINESRARQERAEERSPDKPPSEVNAKEAPGDGTRVLDWTGILWAAASECHADPSCPDKRDHAKAMASVCKAGRELVDDSQYEQRVDYLLGVVEELEGARRDGAQAAITGFEKNRGVSEPGGQAN